MEDNYNILSTLFSHKRYKYSVSSEIPPDAILTRKGPVTRAMSKRLQEDWARAAEEGPRVLMNLRIDF